MITEYIAYKHETKYRRSAYLCAYYVHICSKKK